MKNIRNCGKQHQGSITPNLYFESCFALAIYRTVMVMYMKSMFVLAQMEASPDADANLQKAALAVKEAAETYHGDIIVFPEVYMDAHPAKTSREQILSTAQPLSGTFVKGMQALARQYQIWIVFGMTEPGDDASDDRTFNTTVILDSEGSIVKTYHKTHMYDAFGVRETDTYRAGTKLFTPVDTPFGRIGLFVCYELRFPEIARIQALQGAEILLVPAAWYKGDLKSSHWKTLLTARALENTVFVLGCDLYSQDTYMGESMAVDPLGVPFACASEGSRLIPCMVDTERIYEVRKKLSCLENRRSELY